MQMKQVNLSKIRWLLKEALPGLTLEERLEYLAKRVYGSDTYKKNHKRITERLNEVKKPMNVQERQAFQFSAALEKISALAGLPYNAEDYLQEIKTGARFFRGPIEEKNNVENDAAAEIAILTKSIIAGQGKREEQLERIARLMVQQNEKLDQIVDILCRLLKEFAGENK